jgi:hypothetical protein
LLQAIRRDGKLKMPPRDKLSGQVAANFAEWIRMGATDEHGVAAVENRMHFHDLHATILHLLGLDHEALTYKYAGRDFRLTDVHGNVAHDIIA